MSSLGSLLKAGWTHLRGKAYAGRNLVVYPDDVFLVSYPRSGNTWTRFLIGNFIHLDGPVTFENIDSIIPDIYGNTHKQLMNTPRPRLIKSHECFDPRYKRVIYIVRDPRDVAVSMYHWGVKRRRFDESYPMEKHIERFVAGDYEFTAGSWGENVSCWLASRLNDPNFILLRYEDMLRQPHGELARIAKFLELECTDERLNNAIERSSPERMRSLEKAQAASWSSTARTRQDRPFVRAAKDGNWKTDLPADSVALIEAAWWPIMEMLGYELTTSPQAAPGRPIVSKETWTTLTARSVMNR